MTALFVGLFATRNGIDYSMDSAFYLSYAERIHDGYGLSTPITSYQSPSVESWISAWPPLYPVMLALGSSPMNTARFISVVSLLCSTLLTYSIGWTTIGSKWAAALGAIIFLTIPTVMSQVFAVAHSESVFTMLALGVVALLGRYRFGQPASARAALIAAALIAMAMLIRYLGVTLAFAALVYMILWARSVNTPRRWLPLLFILLSFIPLILYGAYLKGLTGSWTGVQSTTDTLSFADVPESIQRIGLEMLHGWMFMFRQIGLLWRGWAALAGGLLLLGIAALAWVKRRDLKAALSSWDFLLVMYVGVYLCVFWLLSLRSNAIIANWRHFIPIYPALIILLAHVMHVVRFNRWLAAAVTAIYIVSGISALITTSEGAFYNGADWRSAPLLARLPELVPTDGMVYGNDVGYLTLHLGTAIPVRMFGGESAFTDHSCSELVVPAGYKSLVFTLFDSTFLTSMPQDELERYFRDWAAPCGTVTELVMDDFSMIMVVDVSDQPVS